MPTAVTLKSPSTIASSVPSQAPPAPAAPKVLNAPSAVLMLCFALAVFGLREKPQVPLSTKRPGQDGNSTTGSPRPPDNPMKVAGGSNTEDPNEQI